MQAGRAQWASHYLWRNKFGDMSFPQAKRLKELEVKMRDLRSCCPSSCWETMIKDALRKNGERTDAQDAGAASL